MNQIIKLSLLLAIGLLSNISFAQFDDELSKEIELELGEIDLATEGIEKLENTVPDYQRPPVDYKEKKFNWDDDFIAKMQSLEARHALVKRGTRVYSLKKQKFFEFPRDLNVKVLAGHDRFKQTYILNSENEAVFQINFEDVIITHQVRKIRTLPKAYEEYEPRKLFSYDQTSIFHELSFVAFNQTADFIVDNLNIDSDSIFGSGFQYQVHFDFNFPILLGLESQYLAGSSDTQFGEFNLTQLTLGPVVNIPFGNFNNRKVFFQLSSQFGLFHRLESTQSQSQVSFNSQSYSLGFRLYFPSIIGEIVTGIRYAVDFRNPKSSDVPLLGDDVTSRDQALVLSGGLSW